MVRRQKKKRDSVFFLKRKVARCTPPPPFPHTLHCVSSIFALSNKSHQPPSRVSCSHRNGIDFSAWFPTPHAPTLTPTPSVIITSFKRHQNCCFCSKSIPSDWSHCRPQGSVTFSYSPSFVSFATVLMACGGCCFVLSPFIKSSFRKIINWNVLLQGINLKDEIVYNGTAWCPELWARCFF